MDKLLIAADSALRTLFAAPRASRVCATLPEHAASPLSRADPFDSEIQFRAQPIRELRRDFGLMQAILEQVAAP